MLDLFSPDRGKKSGRKSACKNCTATNARNLRIANPEAEREKRAKLYWKSPELFRARSLESYYKNPKAAVARTRAWVERNPDRAKQTRERWLSTSPTAKLAKTLRNRVYKALNRRSRSSSLVVLLGCSLEELRRYLEAKFWTGMTWANHGQRGWHIDHIRPLASFDLADPAQQRDACHYTNLQPLWAVDNLRKSDKWQAEVAV